MEVFSRIGGGVEPLWIVPTQQGCKMWFASCQHVRGHGREDTITLLTVVSFLCPIRLALRTHHSIHYATSLEGWEFVLPSRKGLPN